MYGIAIVEDNPESVEKLKRYLKRFSEEQAIHLTYNVFSNGMEFIGKYKADYDVVLMDIEMPYLDGMSAARKLRKIDEEVCLIFVTNLAQYAIEGYEVKAMDFLVKPVEYQNFQLKLQKALKLRSRVQKQEIVINTPPDVQRIRLDEIYYIEVINHTLVYHTERGEFVERYPMKEREEQLKEYDFARPSNSYLVNLRFVTAISGGDIVVAGAHLPVGRTKKKDFLRQLTEYMGDMIQ